MLKGLLRFGGIWLITMFVTPYVNRAFDRVAMRAPKDSFLEKVMLELSNNYSAALIRSFGETLGDLAFGSKK